MSRPTAEESKMRIKSQVKAGPVSHQIEVHFHVIRR